MSRSSTQNLSGNHGFAVAVLTPTDDAIKRLNMEARHQEVTKRGKTQQLIEKQVEDFLESLDKATRSQLSKTQLIKSLEKVHKWSKENRKYLSAQKTVPKQWMDLDLDPAEWSEKKTIPDTASSTSSPSNAPAPSSSSSSNPSSSTAANLAAFSSKFPPFSGYAPRQQETQFLLTGAIYERERAHKCPTMENQNITGVRTIKMKEWLQRRAGRQMDRDSIRKWVTSTAKKENLPQADVLKIYARKRRDLGSNELQQLLEMADSKELSINDLLTQYRSEVALAPKRDDGSSDDSDDDEPQPKFRTAPSAGLTPQSSSHHPSTVSRPTQSNAAYRGNLRE